MGSSVSAILAILYMGHIESIALNKLCPSVGLYTRYVDDIFLLTKCKEEAEKVYDCFNSIDSNIKFEIEHPSTVDKTKVLKLLDVAIHVEETGVTSYEFYKKEAKKPIFVNFRSSLPTRNKKHYIKNERNRIVNNCSNKDSAKRHLTEFNKILKVNNYPDSFINCPHTRPGTSNSRMEERNESNVEFSYFNFPYINDGINRRIRNCFQREGLNVRLYHKTFSLRSALKSKQTSIRKCNKKDCNLDNKLCFRKDVVYEVICNKCSNTYIGSTIRPLHDRIHEHLNNDNSSVKKHLERCGASSKTITVKILDQEKRKGSLRIREAFYINKLNPVLNNKEESSIDLILFYNFVLPFPFS